MRWFIWSLAWAANLSTLAHAQTLRDAVESAWLRQPTTQARVARTEEFAARRDAARSWIRESPSVSVSQRTDRWYRNEGTRELGAEIALPIALPGERDRQQRVAEAETNRYESEFAALKWKLAGEVREAYWQARLTLAELRLAVRKVEEAKRLADDAERRMKTGDLARGDLNQARGAEQLARAILAETEARVFRAQRVFAALTGLSMLPTDVEVETTAFSSVEMHPQMRVLEHTVDAARARLALAQTATRDPPEVALGIHRERSAFGERYDNSAMVSLRVPLATDARNQPRITAASAELAEAQAQLLLEKTKLTADIEAAREELGRGREALAYAETRFQFAADTQALFEKAFEFGEIDLVTRLRSENERFDAELALVRVRLEAARAVSRLNQALGILP